MALDNKNILILGMSKMGKTHFGAQLYGRLKAGRSCFKLRKTPSDLSLFEEVLDNLNQGLEGKHTDSKLHEVIVLPITSDTGVDLEIIYPDYGGEQIRGMLEQRQVNRIWQDQIRNSDSWFLFIRLDLIEKIADVSTRFYKQIEEEKGIADKHNSNITDLSEESSAFYVELLQALLSIKQISIASRKKPNLTILVSCWDKLRLPKGTIPSMILKDKMPLFSNFVNTIWDNSKLQIVGLSSLEKDLNRTNPDNDYAADGPEKYGYLVLDDGREEKDITSVLKSVLL